MVGFKSGDRRRIAGGLRPTRAGRAQAPAATTAATTAGAGAPASTTAGTGTTPASTGAATTGASQASGGTLNVAIADLGTENMDVIIPQVNNVIPLIYEPLLRYDPQGNLVPWLAESFSMSPDGKLWTFNLRKDVKWSNGDDLTSDDVKFSFERFISDDSKSPWSPLHRQTVDHIETPDKYTVQVYAKDPPYVFYPDAVQGTAIIPQKYFNQVGLDTFQKQPVGHRTLDVDGVQPWSERRAPAQPKTIGAPNPCGTNSCCRKCRRSPPGSRCSNAARRTSRVFERQRRSVARQQRLSATSDESLNYPRAVHGWLLVPARTNF